MLGGGGIGLVFSLVLGSANGIYPQSSIGCRRRKFRLHCPAELTGLFYFLRRYGLSLVPAKLH